MRPYQLALPALSMLSMAPWQRALAADDNQGQDTGRRPNVIFLVADDLGFGDMECYGAKNIQTPNVNRLADEGIRFTNCHATASTSTPSRYGLLTGEYAWRRSDTDVVPGNSRALIRPSQYTIARLFQDNGYYTGAIGKWHLGIGEVTGEQDWNGVLTWTPRDIGFDYHYIQAATADRVPCVYIEQDTVANYDPSAPPIEVSYSTPFAGEPLGSTSPSKLKLKPSHGHNQAIVDSISRIGYMKGGGKALWKDENIADSIADHSRRFIMEHKDEPFFLYLCTNDPHVPRWPHERFRGKNPMGLRGDALASFDWTVGEVLKALDDAGVADNTLLILTSDNGPILDDGYVDRAIELLNGHSPSGPYRGFKYSGYEGGTVVPFIVRWPDRIKPDGKPNNTLLSHIDLFGSMAELIGGEIPQGAAQDSGNTLDQMLGASTEHRPWVSELNNSRTLSVRTARWKYLPGNNKGTMITWGANVETGNQPYDQLYDMDNDIAETNNLAETYPEIVEQMQRVWLDASGVEFKLPEFSTDENEYWYTLTAALRDNRCMSVSNANYAQGSDWSVSFHARGQWKFVQLEDGTCHIINRKTGGYLTPNDKAAGRLKVEAEAPERGWRIDYAATSGCVVLYTDDLACQVYQKDSSSSYQVVNQGSKTHDDSGAQFRLSLVTEEPLNEVRLKLAASATAPVTSTADNPVWYTIYAPNRDNRCTTCNPYDGLIGVTAAYLTPGLAWRFEEREDGDLNMINLYTGEYIDTNTRPDNTKQLATSATEPEYGWTLTPVTAKTYTITCGAIQFNQSETANNFRILNWGNGTNTTDKGCTFSFMDITDLLNEVTGVELVNPDMNRTDGLYHDMLGRPVANPGHGIFIAPDGKKVIL